LKLDTELKSLSITDFRSIHGTVAIPLQAPVVLLHGPNGAGKTTVMSALELALAGTSSEIASLETRDLVHRDCDEASIELLVSGADDVIVTIDGEAISGRPLLGEDDSRFLVERCSLRQRLLGKLLEFYEDQAEDGETRLTAFVKDLLGIEELESLINGLDPLRDRRLIKNLVPTFRDLEAELKTERPAVERLESEMQEENAELTRQRAALEEILRSLGVAAPQEEDWSAPLERIKSAALELDEQLIDLAGKRREIASLAKRAAKDDRDGSLNEMSLLEDAASTATKAASEWRATDGEAFERTLDDLRQSMPGVPAASGVADPSQVLRKAVEEVTSELERLAARVEEADASAVRATQLNEMIAATNRRLEGIDEQLAESSAANASQALIEALVAIAPHVDGEICPVCGRDYSELGKTPLAAHIAEEITKFGAEAERLREIAKARVSALAERRELEERLAIAEAARLSPEQLSESSSLQTRLAGIRGRLMEMEPGIERGGGLVRAQTESERDLAVAKERDRVTAEAWAELRRLATSLDRPMPAKGTALGDYLDGLQSELDGRISECQERLAKCEQIGEFTSRRERTATRLVGLERDLKNRKGYIARAEGAVTELEERRKVLRRVHDAAEKARALTVSAVFNDTLNRVWRDLFVRLAPEEPFVPAFTSPPADHGVEARLVTEHRDGAKGGSPASMLSAGNLNTAALTLFLALNLSAPPRLPWLLLDDPVQSMDEIHVSQFAALLRTLTRTSDRRVVLAVHERALFDYLSLELSPAREGEALVTVELERGPDGISTASTQYVAYADDPAFASR
jgi:exonuclease SbcC